MFESADHDPRSRRILVATSLCALALGLGHAAVSAYWALGGTALLDTIGGDIERLGRERGTGVLLALGAIALLKAIVAFAAPAVAKVPVQVPDWAARRFPRRLTWIAAVVLTLYGGVLTITGLLVQANVLDTSADADQRALAWHAYLWDPWFLLWGLFLIVTLRLSRPRSPN